MEYGRMVDCAVIAGLILLGLAVLCHDRTNEIMAAFAQGIRGGFTHGQS